MSGHLAKLVRPRAFHLLFIRFRTKLDYDNQFVPILAAADTILGKSEAVWDDANGKRDEKCPDFTDGYPHGIVAVAMCEKIAGDWSKDLVTINAPCKVPNELNAHIVVSHTIAHELTHQLGHHFDHLGDDLDGRCHDSSCECLLNWSQYSLASAAVAEGRPCNYLKGIFRDNVFSMRIGNEHYRKGCQMDRIKYWNGQP